MGTSTVTDSREAQARYDLVIAQEIAAENDGLYEISSGTLADFPKGLCELEVVQETAILLSSQELGAGAMELTLAGRVVVRLAD